MIPLPANVKLVVALLLVGGLGALNAIYNVEPTWKWIGSAAGVLTLLETFFTVPPSAAAKLKAAAVKPLAMLLLVGCGQPVFPTLQKIEQTVVDDLSASPPKSDAQIAADVCADLGGTSATDAVCADVETTVQDVIVVLLDTGALPAIGRARGQQYLAAHPRAAK